MRLLAPWNPLLRVRLVELVVVTRHRASRQLTALRIRDRLDQVAEPYFRCLGKAIPCRPGPKVQDGPREKLARVSGQPLLHLLHLLVVVNPYVCQWLARESVYRSSAVTVNKVEGK